MTSFFVNVPATIQVVVEAETEGDITEEMVDQAFVTQYVKFPSNWIEVHLDQVSIDSFTVTGDDK